jgi:hypothetical protein
MAMKQKTVTIASGGTTSEAIRMDNYAFAGLILPGTLTSTACTFTVSDTATGTFVPLADGAGNHISITVAASHAIAITGTAAEALAMWAYVKLVFGSAEGGARQVVCCLK